MWAPEPLARLEARRLATHWPPQGRQQVVAGLRQTRARLFPSNASGGALLISMILLASAAPARVACRSTSALAISLREPKQLREATQTHSDKAPDSKAAYELDLESATISHHETTTRHSNDKVDQLNESLRALNEIVVESRLSSLATAPPKASATGEQLELGDEQEDDFTSAMMVRQLGNLLMSQEEEGVIARTLAVHAGELDNERSRRAGRQLPPAESSVSQWTPTTGATMADESLENSLGEGQGGAMADHNLLPHTDDEGALITCPPDYDERGTLLVPTNISELFGDSLVANASSITAEQRQQLLSGAEASGFALAAGGADGASGELNETALLQRILEWQQQQQRHMQLRPPCLSVGMGRIDVITKTITPILFGIIIVIGLVGNVVVMLVIMDERKVERELTPTNLLILDLSLADLSFIIFCIPFTGWDYATGYWAFGSLWCKLNQYLIVVCALSSIYTLVLMSCDRFMAIVYPIECISYRTSRNMMHAIVIKWIVILLAALPAIEKHGLISSPVSSDQSICRFLADRHNPLHFQIVFFLTSYLFPLVLIFGLYLSLLNKLWFGQRPQGHKESHKMLESKKKVTWLVASIVIVFAVCWCPIQIMLILMRLKTIDISATYIAIQVFAHTLGYMNSCVNPIVYAFASETFYQSFRRSWLARLFCCTPNSLYYGNNGLSQANHNNNSTIVSNANSSRPQNFKQFTHHPDTITLTAHLNSIDQHKPAARSSLQIMNATDGGVHHGNTSNGSHRNTSLNLIFERPTGTIGDTSPTRSTGGRLQNAQPASRRLPLEPRDRDQVVSPPPPPQMATIHRPAFAPASITNEQVAQVNGNPPINHMPSGESTNPNATGAKQQLVARMVRQSSGTGNQVVAHDCEPCESGY